MAFELRGHDVLSYGEYMRLVECMAPDAPMPQPLVAWFAGERVAPRSLSLGLQKAAVYVVDDEGHEILSRAARRMDAALGREEFCFDEMPPAEPGEWDGGL